MCISDLDAPNPKEGHHVLVLSTGTDARRGARREVWWCSPYKPLFYRSHTLPVRVTEQHVYYCTDWGEDRGKLIRRRTRLFMDQGEDQAESQGPSQDRSIMHGPRQCLALVNDNEQKLYNILNAHGLGVYYTITTSQEMNHHYSTAGLSPSAISAWF